MGNKVVHFEMSGSDPKALHKFYGDLFGWNVDANNPMEYGMVTPDDAGLGGGIGGTPDGNPHVTVYVEVDDLDEALKKAESLGGKTINPPMDVPGGPTLAHFADPAGNMIGILKAGSMG